MPHNGFIYEASMDMMENSGHWAIKESRFLAQPGFNMFSFPKFYIKLFENQFVTSKKINPKQTK